MLEQFTKIYNDNVGKFHEKIQNNLPYGYEDIIKNVINFLNDFLPDDTVKLDSEKITEIDNGHYQGTLLFLIPEDRYQPYDYFYVKIDYGSCSGCDTLESVLLDLDRESPSIMSMTDLFNLHLHVLQELKKLD